MTSATSVIRDERADSTAAARWTSFIFSVRNTAGAKSVHVASPCAASVLSAPNESPLVMLCLTIERV